MVSSGGEVTEKFQISKGGCHAQNVFASVYAIVVTYYPDLTVLGELLGALHAQVGRILLIDNSPADCQVLEVMLRERPRSGVHLVRFGENLGIARALNIGIRMALDDGAAHILLSDQDSLPATDMVAGLLRALDEMRTQGLRVGAVGPIYTDINTGRTFPFKALVSGKFFPGEVFPNTERPHVDALSLITSGTLIPAPVFSAVGLMLEDLFIDRVDTEWCLRARSLGYFLCGTSYARLYQRMGDGVLRVWYFGWRSVSIYAPVRLYYQIRNSAYLCRSDYIGFRLKVRNIWYAFGVAYSQIVFGRRRLYSCKMALRGLWDGLIGRMGRYEP